MPATLSCASAASYMFGKKGWKALYPASACAIAAVLPSAYHESATPSFARAMYSESGYVLINVWNVSRATSYWRCSNASEARSNKTLSGCLESRFASGFSTLFLCEQPPRMTANVMTTVIADFFMNTHFGIRKITRPCDLPMLDLHHRGFVRRL